MLGFYMIISILTAFLHWLALDSGLDDYWGLKILLMMVLNIITGTFFVQLKKSFIFLKLNYLPEIVSWRLSTQLL